MIGDIKNIIIIESLQGERKTGEELYEDCIRRRIIYQEKDFTHAYHSVNTKKDFLEILEFYIHNCPYMNEGVLIHLEMHGDENKKGLVLSDGSLINWQELNNKFREINIITKDNLFITMATCYGRYLYLGTDPYKKSPFSGYISASDAIYPEEIIDKFFILFEGLIEKGNLVDAYLEMEKTSSNFYYKDRKRTFDEAFSSTMEKLYGDMNLKKQILENAEKQMLKETGVKLTDKENDAIFEKAISDIYQRSYNAFKF